MKPPVIPGLRPDQNAVVNRLLSRIHTKPSAANSLEKLYTWAKGELIVPKELRELLAVLVSAELLDQLNEDGGKVAVPSAKKPTLALCDSDRFVLTSKGLERLEGIGRPAKASPAPKAPPAAPAPAPVPPPAPPAPPAPAPVVVAPPPEAAQPVPPPAVEPPPAPPPAQDEPATAPTIPPPPASEEVERAPESGERTAPPAAENDDTTPPEERPSVRPAELAPTSDRKPIVSPEAPTPPAAPYAGVTAAPPAAIHTAPPGLPVWLSLTPEQLRSGAEQMSRRAEQMGRAAEIVEALTAIGRQMVDLVALEASLLDEAAQLDAGLPVAVPVIPEASAPLGPLDVADQVAAEMAPPAPAVAVVTHEGDPAPTSAESRIFALFPRKGAVLTKAAIREAETGTPEGTIGGAIAKLKSRGLLEQAERGSYRRVA